MSYILDALRRAESERERGSLPTLHGQATAAPRPVVAGEEGGAHPSRLTLWLALLALCLGLLALGLYFWPRGGEKPLPAPALLPPMQTQTPMPTAQPTAQAQVPTLAPAAVVLPSAPAPRPDEALPPPALPTRAQPQVISKAPTAPAPAPAPAPVAERPLPSKDGLPEDLRRELPPLVTGGAMYSDTPANRMLIINSQVWHEGDKIAPNLTLEQIRLRSAVLVFKGQRFTLAY
ncbi:hypothetical protein DBR47_06745 [Paucibacter sp. KBW04]|uniref:general secretion pathway protein GspB n=1 Tax=Paucibacter sp. KBW04 TaxID=2153361 RepID=UPI000F56A314|nr:general secretion pathway protein GspB [Paucibacter sp. KBW04]RQO61821.1 hypothetical protein DBR47_06745 [Paucibacter sp. KBW04]